METLFIPQEQEFKKWIKEAIAELLPEIISEINKPRDPSDEPLLTRKEIAEYLRISLVTLNTWMKKGFPYLREEGKIRFLKSEVMVYMKEKRKTSQALFNTS